MSTLVESKETLRTRCREAHLTDAEIDSLIANNITSLARLAFALGPPGTAPNDDQVRTLFTTGVGPNIGTLASVKRLIFEAQTMFVAEMKAKVQKKDDTQATLALAERDARIADQRKRLTGLRLRGDEECSHNSYALVLQIVERDTLTYLPPERFTTRRSELQQKKPGKELALDDEHVFFSRQDLHGNRQDFPYTRQKRNVMFDKD